MTIMHNDTMTGRAVKYQMQEQAQLASLEVSEPEPGFDIHVKVDSPEQGNAFCIVLSAANPVKAVLPQDPTRRSAVLLAVDNDVYISSSREVAQGAAGGATDTNAFYLPAGIGIPFENKSAFWAAVTTTATSSRISVLINKDES